MLVDFILEYIIPKEPVLNLAGPRMELGVEEVKVCRVLQVDGSSKNAGSGIGQVLTSPKGVVAKYACASNSKSRIMKLSMKP